MFSNSYQSGFLSIFYSCGSSPLALWDMKIQNGYVKRVTDEEVKSLALEIVGTNVATTYIYCPADSKKVLGIKLPFLIMIIKNLKKYFTFEITILDNKKMHRRFRVSNFQSTTKVRPFCTTMPIGLSGGWNQIQFNLADFTRRAYGSNYVETSRMQIHANCRIRRIYFADRLYAEDEMPEEFKLFLPIHPKKCNRQKKEVTSEVNATPADKSPMFNVGDSNAPQLDVSTIQVESLVTETKESTKQNEIQPIQEVESKTDEIFETEEPIEENATYEEPNTSVKISIPVESTSALHDEQETEISDMEDMLSEEEG
ncbi:cilia- and flagella-associated protein 20-like [Orussus abietinus]|uniref:cilia- and flagella-associated protein 20-like n=1 Tax=Orussus abietinus TaxID=222816 RepID=UPI0006250107|nr:cilia- and flagella-associated protein 20-like [Orussus abietinus]